MASHALEHQVRRHRMRPSTSHKVSWVSPDILVLKEAFHRTDLRDAVHKAIRVLRQLEPLAVFPAELQVQAELRALVQVEVRVELQALVQVEVRVEVQAELQAELRMTFNWMLFRIQARAVSLACLTLFPSPP